MRTRDAMGGFLESEYENSEMNENECDECKKSLDYSEGIFTQEYAVRL